MSSSRPSPVAADTCTASGDDEPQGIAVGLLKTVDLVEHEEPGALAGADIAHTFSTADRVTAR